MARSIPQNSICEGFVVRDVSKAFDGSCVGRRPRQLITAGTGRLEYRSQLPSYRVDYKSHASSQRGLRGSAQVPRSICVRQRFADPGPSRAA